MQSKVCRPRVSFHPANHLCRKLCDLWRGISHLYILALRHGISIVQASHWLKSCTSSAHNTWMPNWLGLMVIPCLLCLHMCPNHSYITYLGELQWLRQMVVIFSTRPIWWRRGKVKSRNGIFLMRIRMIKAYAGMRLALTVMIFAWYNSLTWLIITDVCQ